MTDVSAPELPLQGLRVVSLAEQYPGPLATMLLADLGADVILVERPGGDPSRRYAGHFAALNRNKRSMLLDLKSEDGRAAFHALLKTSDALLEGFRPGVMARLGFGHEMAAEEFPGLVYCSISAFGQQGPFTALAGHDLSVQGVAGMLDIPVGAEARTPLPVLPVADIASGMFAALGVVAMLLGRCRNRAIAPIDVSMMDSLAFWMAPLSLPRANHLRPAPFPPGEPAYGIFATRDGRQITLSIAGENHMWQALCAVLALDDLAMLHEHERVAQREHILPRLRAAIAAREFAWLEGMLTEKAIAWGPVLGLVDAARDERIAARGLFLDIPDDAGTNERHVRQPLLFGGKAAMPHRRAPELGEHTQEILESLGLHAAGR